MANRRPLPPPASAIVLEMHYKERAITMTARQRATVPHTAPGGDNPTRIIPEIQREDAQVARVAGAL